MTLNHRCTTLTHFHRISHPSSFRFCARSRSCRRAQCICGCAHANRPSHFLLQRDPDRGTLWRFMIRYHTWNCRRCKMAVKPCGKVRCWDTTCCEMNCLNLHFILDVWRAPRSNLWSFLVKFIMNRPLSKVYLKERASECLPTQRARRGIRGNLKRGWNRVRAASGKPESHDFLKLKAFLSDWWVFSNEWIVSIIQEQ